MFAVVSIGMICYSRTEISKQDSDRRSVIAKDLSGVRPKSFAEFLPGGLRTQCLKNLADFRPRRDARVVKVVGGQNVTFAGFFNGGMPEVKIAILNSLTGTALVSIYSSEAHVTSSDPLNGWVCNIRDELGLPNMSSLEGVGIDRRSRHGRSVLPSG